MRTDTRTPPPDADPVDGQKTGPTSLGFATASFRRWRLRDWQRLRIRRRSWPTLEYRRIAGSNVSGQQSGASLFFHAQQLDARAEIPGNFRKRRAAGKRIGRT